MRKTISLTLLSLLIFSVSFLSAAEEKEVVVGGVKLAPDEPPPPAKASLRGSTFFIKKEGPHKGHEMKRFDITLDGYKQRYFMQYTYCADPIHQKEGTKILDVGSFGFWQPSAAGLFYRKFLSILVNGREPVDYTPGKVRVWEEKGSASAEISWQDPKVALKMTMKVLDGDRRLFLRFGIEPKEKIESLVLKFKGYPGGFQEATDADGLKRDRYYRTAFHSAHVKTFGKGKERTSDKSARLTLDVKRENWVVLGDDALDPEKNDRGEGAVAFLFLPEEISAAEVQVNSYDAFLVLTYPPTSRAMHICIWGFGKRGNRWGERLVGRSARETMEVLKKW